MITVSISFPFFFFFIAYSSKYSSLSVPIHLLSVLNYPILLGSFHTETTSGSDSSCFLPLLYPFKSWCTECCSCSMSVIDTYCGTV